MYPYPWLERQWQRLVGQIESNRLPHAVLLRGLEGLGIIEFAHCFIQALLCEVRIFSYDAQGVDNTFVACGKCSSCKQFQVGFHPDVVILDATESSVGVIKVDQVRMLLAFLQQTAQLGGYRVVLIQRAEAMNMAAQNALLKVLEEPGEDVVFMLVSHCPSLLLPTVVSRCQSVECTLPTTVEVQQWWREVSTGTEQEQKHQLALLSVVGGAPLRLRQYLASSWYACRLECLEGLCDLLDRKISLYAFVQKALDWPLADLLALMLSLGIDALKLSLNSASEYVSNQDALFLLNRFSNQSHAIVSIDRFVSVIESLYLSVQASAAQNHQLSCERALLSWQALSQYVNGS